VLSISQPIKGASPGEYYLSLAKEDYYLQGGEPPGQWIGGGAEELGLKGEVSREELQNIMQGFSADGEEALVQNAGAKDRRSAWDLTFSAPKSVSVVWSQSSGEVRSEIQEAHKEAVKKSLQYLNDAAAITRRGKGGVSEEQVNLAVAAFEHGTSRAGDPQLHTHALVMNVAKRVDGSSGTIETRPLFQHKMAAGALYRAELSHQLESRLGLLSSRQGSSFELIGVSKELAEEFSKRRREIKKTLLDQGYTSAVAAKVVTLNTREVKGHISREQLFSEWQKKGEELGWSKNELGKLLSEERPRRDITFERARTTEQALDKATVHSSHFPKRDIVRYSAEEAQGRGIGAEAVLSEVENQFRNSSEIVSLGRVKGDIHYSTKEMIELERGMLADVYELNSKPSSPVRDEALKRVFMRRSTISSEQKEAVRHIASADGAIKVVSGMAGTGKSYMLGAAREALEASGFVVYGTAISGKAAQGLTSGSGISSQTIAKTFNLINSGELKLGRNSVLIVDEAGMVGTRLMAELVSLVKQSGAKLVLVGDSKQLQPIDAGGPLAAIAKKIGERKLTKIVRQRDIWAREAVQSFASGDSKTALRSFSERGLLSVSDTRQEAIGSLVKAWEERGVTGPKEHIIIVSTNQDAADLNYLAQERRKEAGELGNSFFQVNSDHFYAGDRVLFTKNSLHFKVKNGTLGTVLKVRPGKEEIEVQLDSGLKTRIQTKTYKHFKLGYAITTHKAQGMTAENAYLLVGGPMQDREFSYVQASRAKLQTRIFTDRLEAGDELQELTRQMANSRQKDLAVSLLEKQRRLSR